MIYLDCPDCDGNDPQCQTCEGTGQVLPSDLSDDDTYDAADDDPE